MNALTEPTTIPRPTREFVGTCHCGAVKVRLVTGKLPDELAPRACQCSFCRRHGALTLSDPDGEAEIRSGAALRRYRFARRSADFLVCGTCGIYVAAILTDHGSLLSTINVGGLRMAPWCDRQGVPVEYSDETDAERLARRRSRWTPTRLIEAAP